MSVPSVEGRHAVRRHGRRRVAPAWALAAGLIVSGLLVLASTNATYTAPTATTAAMTAGTVTLSNDTSAPWLFNPTGLTPGSTGSRCVDVDYTGTLDARIRLYPTATSGSLAPYLHLVVEMGSGGSFGSCTGFTSAQTLWTGTLADLAATSTSWATGLGRLHQPGCGPRQLPVHLPARPRHSQRRPGRDRVDHLHLGIPRRRQRQRRPARAAHRGHPHPRSGQAGRLLDRAVVDGELGDHLLHRHHHAGGRHLHACPRHRHRLHPDGAGARGRLHRDRRRHQHQGRGPGSVPVSDVRPPPPTPPP